MTATTMKRRSVLVYKYHSVACLMLELGRKALFPDILGFNSATVTTPISLFCFSLNVVLFCSVGDQLISGKKESWSEKKVSHAKVTLIEGIMY